MPKGLQQPLPLFREGDTVELVGVIFTVQRINRSNIVLRPVTTGAQRARDIIRKLTLHTKQRSEHDDEIWRTTGSPMVWHREG